MWVAADPANPQAVGVAISSLLVQFIARSDSSMFYYNIVNENLRCFLFMSLSGGIEALLHQLCRIRKSRFLSKAGTRCQ